MISYNIVNLTNQLNFSTDSQPAQTAQGPYRVAMLGASGVGKTALTCQFTTSEYICAYDASLGKYSDLKDLIFIHNVLLNIDPTSVYTIIRTDDSSCREKEKNKRHFYFLRTL